MNKMSEDEIIEIVKDFISYIRFDEKPKYGVRQQYMAIENLLDLYQKEKGKNKELIERNKALSNNMLSLACNSVRKDKIKEKIESIENTLEVCDEEINYKLKIEDKAQIEVLKELLEEE